MTSVAHTTSPRGSDRKPRAGRPVRLTIAPALLVALPLMAFSFQGDERRNIYYNAERFGSNPLEAGRQAIEEIRVFLRLGNFRPLGRFFDYTEHTLVFESAEAVGLPPHVVHGVVRLAMLAALVLIATRLVEQITSPYRSTGQAQAIWYTPGILALALVAGGPESPITHFPFLFIGSACLVLAIPQVVVQTRDLIDTHLGVRPAIFVALIGATTAMFFDMVYIAPPLTTVYLMAKSIATGTPLRTLAFSTTAKRVAALLFGFLLIFVPARLAIAAECANGGCYSGSDLNPGINVLPITLDRIVTGIPVAGWAHNADIAASAGLAFSLRDMFANSLLVAITVGLAYAVVVAAIRSRRRNASSPAAGRVAAALGLLAAALITLPAVLVSLSRLVQREQFAIGQAWRDTLLVQTGWALALIAGILGVSNVVRRRHPSAGTTVDVAIVVGLCLGLTLTLFANERLDRVDHRDPLAILTNQISAATIDFDLTEGGNSHRCDLIGRYTQLQPNREEWTGGPMLRQNLDQLIIARRGRPFCEEPATG